MHRLTGTLYNRVAGLFVFLSDYLTQHTHLSHPSGLNYRSQVKQVATNYRYAQIQVRIDG